MERHGIIYIIILYVFLLPGSSLSMEEAKHDHDHGRGEQTESHEEHAQGGHDDHSDHADEHAKNEEHVDTDGHDDHENSDSHEKHDGHEGHDDNEEGATIVLTDRAKEFVGLTLSTVDKKTIGRHVELPGEIGFNEDRMVHIVPRYPGIVKKVVKKLGATVKKNELLAVVESNESLTTYNILSPISGKIIEKHITAGEFVGEDATLFIIVDLSTVWVNCGVYTKDADIVKKGRKIQITSVGTDKQVETTLSYVAPVYNTTTRSMIARAVIPNTDGTWRPGTFVTGKIFVSTEKPVIAVSQNAVQVLDGETVVFVPSQNKNGFEPVVVKKGKENNNYVEILSGLKAHDTYVSKGAFELKAKIVTSALGGHAGHGH